MGGRYDNRHAFDLSSGLLAGTLCTASFITPQSADAQIYHLEEMNTEQIRALDRARTVIIMATACCDVFHAACSGA